MARSLVASAVAICLTGTVAAQIVGTAALSGQVADTGGGVLPGVRVTVVGPGLNAEAITDGRGRFQVDGFLQGRPAVYTIRAELPGFETTTINGITAEPGPVVHIPVVMPVGCLDGIDPPLFVMGTLSERVASADVVAVVRVDASVHHERGTVEVRCGPLVEFTTTVLEPIKNTESGARLKFFQTYNRVAPPPGAEYIALLTWNTDARMYEATVPLSLISVTQGSVPADALREIGVTRDVPLGEAIETLRALIAGR